MRTFEGRFTIKWHKNDRGDARPLTIDCETKEQLNDELLRIKTDFITKGENGKFPHSVKFNISERI
jgi:hypothetical protein